MVRPNREQIRDEVCSDFLASGLLLSLPEQSKRTLSEEFHEFVTPARPHEDADALFKLEAKRFIERLLPQDGPRRPE